MTYTTRESDMSWRKVMLTKSDEPKPYTKVTGPNQRIEYSEDSVLEILLNDGREIQVYDNGGRKKELVCTRKANGEYQLNVEPRYTARLWIQDSNGMEYKIPGNLGPYVATTGPVPGTCVFRISEHDEKIRLKLDKYAAAVYSVYED